jgi:hypothetical protein
MSSRVNIVICWFLLLIFPSAVMAAEMEPAMLSADGAVMVNGKNAPFSTAVFPGDQIATGKDASATVVAKGTTIVLPADSKIVYGRKAIQMEQGRVVITTQSGTQVRLGNLSITPALKMAKFQLYQKGHEMAVASLEGELDISDGVESIVLPAGEMMTHSAVEGEGAAAAAAAGSAGVYVLPSPPPAASGKAPLPGWVVASFTILAVGGTVFGLHAAGILWEAPASCICPDGSKGTTRNCK